MAGGRLRPVIAAWRRRIEWSYSWLSEDEQALFRRLCALRDAFDLDLASTSATFAAWRHALNLLKCLVDKSLIQVMSSDDVPRYCILQTLTHFGRERLLQTMRSARPMAVLWVGLCARRTATRNRNSA